MTPPPAGHLAGPVVVGFDHAICRFSGAAPPRKGSTQGRSVVVTGAAGGIGRAIATSLARCGSNLALADGDDAALAATAQELAAHKVCMSRHHLDVSDRAAIVAFPGLVSGEHPGVSIFSSTMPASRLATPSSSLRNRLRLAVQHQILGRGVDDTGVPAAAAPKRRRASSSG